MQVVAVKKGKNRAGKYEKLELPPPVLATPERMRQLGGVKEEVIGEGNKIGKPQIHHKARCECSLDGYLITGKIGKDEFEAGMRFRAAYMTKAKGIKTRDSLDPGLGGGDFEDSINRLPWAEKTLKQAFAELAHTEALVVVDVCGEGNAAGGTRKVETLRRGLDRLARLWGF